MKCQWHPMGSSLATATVAGMMIQVMVVPGFAADICEAVAIRDTALGILSVDFGGAVQVADFESHSLPLQSVP